VLLITLALTAFATVPDFYGSGARAMGMGGGGVGLVDDGNAARLNPAGLGFVNQPVVGLGISSAFHNLEEVPDLWWDTNRDGVIDDRDAPLDFPVAVDDAAGFHIFAGRNVGGKFGLGLSAYMPTKRVIRFATFEPTLPNYFMYDNRLQRFSASAGIGGQIVKGVSIGASVEVLAAAHLDLWLSIDAGLSGDGETIDELIGDLTITTHEISLDVVPAVAPVLGLQIDVGEWVTALDGLQLGAVYRGSGGIPITANLDIQANIGIEDIGDLEPYVMAVVLGGQINIIDHYVPPYVNLGAAWYTENLFSTYMDVKITNWSAFKLNIAELDLDNTSIDSPLLDLNQNLVDGAAHPAPSYRNTISLQAGTELRLPKIEKDTKWKYMALTVRGGFGFFQSPLLGQSRETVLLDADRTMFTLGAGLEHWDPFQLVDEPVRWDMFAQYNALASGPFQRDSEGEPLAGYPIDSTSIPVGGNIIVVGGQWGFDF